jgi:hypothetical protein
MIGSKASWSVVVAVLAAAPVVAQTPIMGKFAVNDSVAFRQDKGAVAMRPSGESVVVWEDEAHDHQGRSIVGRRFAADGSTIGERFLVVDEVETGLGLFFDVAIAPSGAFLVVWDDDVWWSQPGSEGTIQGRFYSADGVALGPRFQVNSHIPGGKALPIASCGASGNWVVTWFAYSSGGDDTSGTSIQARWLDPEGAPLTPDIQVNNETPGNQIDPAVAMDSAGNAVFVWTTEIGDSAWIKGRRFLPGGTPADSEFRVDALDDRLNYEPKVAVNDNGAFMVVWTRWLGVKSIQGRGFGADGSPRGTQFRVNDVTWCHQRFPDVASAGIGQFVVAWRDADPDVGVISARHCLGDGRFLGPQLEVAVPESYYPRIGLRIAGAPDGRFVVVWPGPDLWGDVDVWARLYRTDAIFLDDLETGDATAWSTSIR